MFLVEDVPPLHLGVEEAGYELEHHVLQCSVLAQRQQRLRLVDLWRDKTDDRRLVYRV